MHTINENVISCSFSFYLFLNDYVHIYKETIFLLIERSRVLLIILLINAFPSSLFHLLNTLDIWLLNRHVSIPYNCFLHKKVKPISRKADMRVRLSAEISRSIGGLKKIFFLNNSLFLNETDCMGLLWDFPCVNINDHRDYMASWVWFNLGS